jgi:hypothetical protein
MDWEKRTDDYYLGVELIDGKPFVHSEIYATWTPSIRREYMNEWHELGKKYGYRNLYCTIPASNIKLNKYVRQFGFKPIASKWVNDSFVTFYRLRSVCYK